ncbi:type II toxin-antitoxin system RelE/ParE family toxin [Sphingomonas sp.]|uniref:type II toxin-antitoxin system RelE/ParE family toxin n=1 Tax=Sphingomonas sp. TaxID=28214 RepID=UPI0035C80538
MAYRLTRQARRDLTAIYALGSKRFGLAAADRYLDGLFSVAGLLANFPEAGRELRGISPPMRVHPYRSHIIIYRPEGTDVEIVRVRHARENWLYDPR